MVEQHAIANTASLPADFRQMAASATRDGRAPKQSLFIKQAFSSKTWNKRRGKQHATLEPTNRLQVKWGYT
jgi:hypothetical protein